MTTKLLLVLLLVLSACAAEDLTETDVGSDEQALISTNGISINGISINGISINGISINGISINGATLSNVTLSATKLSGKNASGQTVSGSGLVGAKLSATKVDGSSVTLRIDSAQTGSGANADVWMYGVSWDAGGGVWTRMCGSDAAGAQILAIPVNGVWDYRSGVVGGGAWTADATRFTFGCRTAGLAKCVEMGYKPWKTLPSGTGSLLNHHLSCVRMLRADYCGDGKSWTLDGQQVNLYDGVGIQADAAAWSLEAEWTPNGAQCVTQFMDTRLRQRGAPPACFPTKIQTACGQLSHFSTGTVLMSEVQ